MRKLLWVCLFLPFISSAQQVYWVTFTHKDSTYTLNKPQQFLSERAIKRRASMGIGFIENDLPVSPQFLSTLSSSGFKIVSKSKWLNGAAIVAKSKEEADVLNRLPFAHSVTPLGSYKVPKNNKVQDVGVPNTNNKFGKPGTSDTSVYGVSFKQLQLLNLPWYHQQYTGKGVWIAVLDAGFYRAHQHTAFTSLFQSGRVLATRDFVVGDTNVFNDDDHGLAVWSCLAAQQQAVYKGSAPDAHYVLLRCEDADSEMPIEEVFWAEAAEFADSMGVDVINSSLGYNEFDEAKLNHTRKQLNGKTTLISRAATMAVATGMVVVNSAGNEGDETWHYVSVPADVPSVITVGAVDAQRNYVAFSSVGPTSDKRIKPDVMAQGDNVWVASPSGSFYQGDGTSYASPIMAGAVACLKQQYPTTTPLAMLNVLHQSSDRYYKPDSYFGYGIPDIKLASDLLGAASVKQDTVLDIRLLKDRKLHLTMATTAEQKITVVVSQPDGTILFTETVLAAKGITRIPLNKSRKLPSGNYKVNCKSSLTLNQTIDIYLP